MVLWRAYTQAESRLLVQAFGLVEEVIPFRRRDGSEAYGASERWTRIHDALSRELGVHELSAKSDGWGHRVSMDLVCKTFVTGSFPRGANADQLMKERLSFIELAFRARENELIESVASLPRRIQEAQIRQAERRANLKKIGGLVRADQDDVAARLTAELEEEKSQFRERVDELNERFRQAGSRLNYHNGFIQLGEDPLVHREVEQPFWRLVGEPRWKNIDTDMKEALDLRDSNGGDPAFYAARALESTIKIISEQKGWTTGKERGAHNFIENLASGRLIAPWESEALKHFYTKVRNPLGHGPGSAEMPDLSPQQTQWAIETCMSWTKTLIERL